MQTDSRAKRMYIHVCMYLRARARVCVCAEKLETMKEEMDERGNSMTDTGPLVKLKDAMKKMKKEIKVIHIYIQ